MKLPPADEVPGRRIRHWTRQDMERLFSGPGLQAERAAAVRHLLAGCEWCAAVVRRTARGPADVDYDQVIDRVLGKLPELAAQAARQRGITRQPTRSHHAGGG